MIRHGNVVLALLPHTPMPQAFSDRLSSVLVAAGFDMLLHSTKDLEAAGEHIRPSPRRLAVSLTYGQEASKSRLDLDKWSRTTHIPWLRVALGIPERIADLGPLFGPPVTPCYRCFALTYLNKAVVREDLSTTPLSSPALWAGLTALEIISALEPGITATRPRCLSRYESTDWENWQLRPISWPGCPLCGCPQVTPKTPKTTFSAHDMTLPIFYEKWVESTTKGNEDQSVATAGLQRPEAISLATRVSRLFSDPYVSTAQALYPDPLSATHRQLARKDIKLLAGLLAGRQDVSSERQRWTANAGNLASVRLHCHVEGVEGMLDGIYRYDPLEHQLVFLSPADLKPELFRLIPRQAANSSRLTLCFSSAVDHLRPKYGAFAYRLQNFDAGVAAGQLLLVASAMGFRVHFQRWWNDAKVHKLTGIDSYAQQIHAIATVLTPSDPVSSLQEDLPPESPSNPRPTWGSGFKPFEPYSETMLLRQLQHESRRAADMPDCRPERRAPQEESTNALQLPSPIEISKPLGTVLSERRSVRHFADSAISQPELHTILAATSGKRSGLENWAHELSHIETHVLVRNVVNLSPGLYLYCRHRRTLTPEHISLTEQEYESLFVQDALSKAPFVVWLTADLTCCKGFVATRHYRQICVAAGLLAQRAHIAATGLQLSGCILAGFVGGAARRLFGWDGYRIAGLIGFAGGFSKDMDLTTRAEAKEG